MPRPNRKDISISGRLYDRIAAALAGTGQSIGGYIEAAINDHFDALGRPRPASAPVVRRRAPTPATIDPRGRGVVTF